MKREFFFFVVVNMEDEGLFVLDVFFPWGFSTCSLVMSGDGEENKFPLLGGEK